MGTNIFYHGGIIVVDYLDSNYNYNKMVKTYDFGPGMYFTTLRKQAEERALSSYEKVNQEVTDIINRPIVNTYTVDEQYLFNNFKSFIFKNYNKEWLEFVINCRNGKEYDYNVVQGPMLDGDLKYFLNTLLVDDITENDVLKASFKKENDQIMVRNEALKCLLFDNAVDVETNEVFHSFAEFKRKYEENV